MPWFIDEDALRQQLTRDLLNTLPDDLPGVLPARTAAAAGVSFSVPLRKAWEQFKRQVDEQEYRLRQSQSELRQLQSLVESYRKDSASTERDALRQQVADLTNRADAAERSLSDLLQAHQRHQDYSQQEINRLQALVAEQNRIIARQHLQLQEQETDD
jgi:septal ring factor EnvC (AmiA/AmiB activator)